MKAVKLNAVALRKLIVEAIQTREPGSPLWSPPSEKKVVKESKNDLPAMLADIVRSSWEELYDDSDPSMQQVGGKQAWDQQVAAAAEQFSARVNGLLDEIEWALVDGEFFEDPGYPGERR